MNNKSLSLWLPMLDRFLDSFIPGHMAADHEQRHAARMFLVSHIFGPILGNILPGFLLMTGHPRDYHLVVFFGSITAFWVFPFALRASVNYRLLVTLSVQNLIFVIMWSCYSYGGPSSPFLPWMLVIPLLAFLYVGRAVWMAWTLPCLMLLNLVGFAALYFVQGGYPKVDIASLHAIGVLSIICAACYVSMMAIYYANILSSQVDLEREVRNHLATAGDLHRAAAHAEQAGVAKTEFVANMSHELRTPLNAVIGFSQLILEESRDVLPEHTTIDLERIRDAGKHLLRLVSDVLDYAKIETGMMELAHEVVDVSDFFYGVLAICRPNMEKNSNTVLVVANPNLGEAEFDVLLLRKALAHVCHNAGKYTTSGTIVVSANRQVTDTTDYIVLVVRDTGLGMDFDRVESIFDAFSAGESESSTAYGGAGIGLALTRLVCRLHGGEITVQSAPNKGSEFTLTIPARASAPKAQTFDVAQAA